jgi:hypothetical protein
MKCNACLAKEKKQAQGANVRACTMKIKLAEIQLQNDPTNEQVRSIFSDAQSKMAKVFQDTVARIQHASAANWLRYDDTCSKTFFDFHRIGKKKAILRELATKAGPITGQQDLSHYISEFYSRLYTSEALAPDTADAQDQCWASVPVKVPKDLNLSLTRDLAVKEILGAISALPKGKASVHDGLPMEFFHECTQEVTPDLLLAFKAML